MHLLQELARDGVDVSALERLYETEGRRSGFERDALGAMRLLDADRAWRASWLLMRAAREGRLDPALLSAIATAAEEMTHWIARLTLCQLFAAAPCPPDARERLYPFLEDCFDDRRVIVRAWALSALAAWGEDPRYAREAAAWRRQARTDPAPAMQARLRALERGRERSGRRRA